MDLGFFSAPADLVGLAVFVAFFLRVDWRFLFVFFFSFFAEVCACSILPLVASAVEGCSSRSSLGAGLACAVAVSGGGLGEASATFRTVDLVDPADGGGSTLCDSASTGGNVSDGVELWTLQATSSSASVLWFSSSQSSNDSALESVSFSPLSSKV